MPKPVLITGHPRGGTTCMARVVEALGVPLYRHKSGPHKRNREDQDLPDAILRKDWAEATRLLHERNAIGWWGWKRPHMIQQMREWEHFEAFQIVFVCRDPVAIAESQAIHGINYDPTQYASHLTNAAAYFADCFGILDRRPNPHILVSYEKLLIHTVNQVGRIADFLRLPYNREAVEEVIASDPRYATI